MAHIAHSRWLLERPLTGAMALLAGTAAVAIPTLIRAALDGVITGCDYSPYIPFVLLAAVALRWWQAALVALASVAATALLFEGSPGNMITSACFNTSALLFLAASATMIGAMVGVRRIVTGILHRGADEPEGDIVFSLENGNIWASWYDSGPRVRLGSNDKVAAMMEDFLAQHQVARRLAGIRAGRFGATAAPAE